MKTRIYWLAVIVIILAGTFFRFWHISSPNKVIFDEVYYPKYANSYFVHESYFDVHPPLAKTFIAAGIYFFGYNSLGWRVAEATFGSLILLVVFLFALSLFKNKIAALFSLLVVSFSTMLFVESRMGLINIFLAFFSILSLYLFWLWQEKNKLLFLILAFAACALAASVKWTGFLLIPFFLFYIVIANFLDSKKIENLVYNKRFFLSLLAAVVVFLGVYIGGFYFANNSQYSFVEWHKQAMGFHQNLTATHPYQSRWWTWPLGLRPIWLEFSKIAEDSYSCIVEIINLPMAWLAIVAFFYAIFRIIKEKKINLLFLVLAITALFISWTVVKRITFLYLFLPVIPLLALLVGGFLAELWSKKQKYLKTIAVVLLVLIAGFFIYFYPLMIGTPVSYKTYYNHMWLKSWY